MKLLPFKLSVPEKENNLLTSFTTVLFSTSSLFHIVTDKLGSSGKISDDAGLKFRSGHWL
jgi:hypothetical protein